jgi:hypothetical protein
MKNNCLSMTLDGYCKIKNIECPYLGITDQMKCNKFLKSPEIIYPEFKGFRKIPRLSRNIIISEKIDGTNGLIYIDENLNVFPGSRKQWLTIKTDNHGFAAWIEVNKEELKKLGTGYHYGEFWGKGINRGYNIQEKRFSLFNVKRWVKDKNIPLKEKQLYCPDCCHIVPILYEGIFSEMEIQACLNNLEDYGSKVSPGFMNPEGIIIYHIAGNLYFKKTIKNDEKGKDEQEK